MTTVQGTAGRPIVNGAFIERNAGVGSDFFSLSLRLSRTFTVGKERAAGRSARGVQPDQSRQQPDAEHELRRRRLPDESVVHVRSGHGGRRSEKLAVRRPATILSWPDADSSLPHIRTSPWHVDSSMMRFRLNSLRALVLAGCLVPCAAFAQTASLSGTLRDETGGALPGVIRRARERRRGAADRGHRRARRLQVRRGARRARTCHLYPDQLRHGEARRHDARERRRPCRRRAASGPQRGRCRDREVRRSRTSRTWNGRRRISSASRSRRARARSRRGSSRRGR